MLANGTAMESLPRFDGEMGDTWIYGIASDPQKNTQFRAMTRAFDSWVAAGSAASASASASGPPGSSAAVADAQVFNFTRQLIKNSEHTWGGDVKKRLNDTTNWTNPLFHRQQFSSPNFKFIANSWQEQRDWGLNFPLEALDKTHPLAKMVEEELKATQVPQEPSPASLLKMGYVQSADPLAAHDCAGGGSSSSSFCSFAFGGDGSVVSRLPIRTVVPRPPRFGQTPTAPSLLSSTSSTAPSLLSR